MNRDQLDGAQFFLTEQKVFLNYLKKTNQKKETAKVIARGVDSLLKKKTPIKTLCIGGGNGEADLEVLKLLPNQLFDVVNSDPSNFLRREFEKKLMTFKNAKLTANFGLKFEEITFPVKSIDLVLCINSIYFLKEWRKFNKCNPLLKIYSILKEGGLAAIVLKSDKGDHFKIKNLADAGNTCGVHVRRMLSKLEIPHYWETIYAEIDISDLFQGKKIWKPNKRGKDLLHFLSKGKWDTFDSLKKSKIMNALIELSKLKSNKYFLDSQYELIWIKKPFTKSESIRAGLFAALPETKKLENKIRPLINNVPDFPVRDVVFRDTSSLLRNPDAFGEIINYAAKLYSPLKIDNIVAKDMQGVLWAGALANKLNVGLVPTFRKDITPPVLSAIYSHEYNPSRMLSLQTNAVKKGQRILIVDYIIATGATVLNMTRLIEHLGGNVVGVFSLMELEYLKPRSILENIPIHTVIKYAKPNSH